MHTINIIPSNYEGDPRKALGYAWADFENQTPGEDVRLERTTQGFQVMEYLRARFGADVEIAAVDFLNPPKGRVIARVNCMWAGGARLAVCLPDADANPEVADADADADPEVADADVDNDLKVVDAIFDADPDVADAVLDAILSANVYDADDTMDAAYALGAAEGADDPVDDDNTFCHKCHTWCYGDCQI